MLSAYEQLVAATNPYIPHKPKQQAESWLHEGSIASRALDVVKDGKDWPLSDIARELGEPEVSTKSALYRLVRKNLITKVGHRKRAQGGRPESIYRRKQ